MVRAWREVQVLRHRGTDPQRKAWTPVFRPHELSRLRFWAGHFNVLAIRLVALHLCKTGCFFGTRTLETMPHLSAQPQEPNVYHFGDLKNRFGFGGAKWPLLETLPLANCHVYTSKLFSSSQFSIKICYEQFCQWFLLSPTFGIAGPLYQAPTWRPATGEAAASCCTTCRYFRSPGRAKAVGLLNRAGPSSPTRKKISGGIELKNLV